MYHYITMASADFSRSTFSDRVSFSTPVRETSPGKSYRFHLMQPPHLLRGTSGSIGLCLALQTRPPHSAFYALPVRRFEILPPASFRFRLTTDTLAFG